MASKQETPGQMKQRHKLELRVRRVSYTCYCYVLCMDNGLTRARDSTELAK